MSRTLAGRYELLEQIGDGGMAVVYKSRDKLLNRYVAIKILKPEFTKDVKLVENFKRESQAAASLVHPNIVGVYDVGREGNINYIVMELVEGKILSDIIKEEAPLDYKKVIDIGTQIAAGLSCAHKNNIIHKDVKPQNVLITKDGVAKITDFGIAKVVDNATIIGIGDMFVGTIHYLSPEQARGGYVDEKSDIYSLGIVLYEMATGKVPFDGNNPVNVALMHINDEIIPPSKIVPSIPPVLEQIIMKATCKIQIDRFKSADEMMEALKNVDLISSIVGNSIYLRGISDENGITEITAGKPPKEESKSKAKNKSKDKNQEKSETEGVKVKNKNKKTVDKVKVLAIATALLCAIPISIFIYHLISSAGEGTVTVPDLSGMTVSEAEQTLEENGLLLEKGDEVYSNDYEAGEICSQTPESDSKVKKGKTIKVSISKGGKEGTVPNIVGKSYADAVYLIQKYGYEVGDITVIDSDMPKDTVVVQKPEAGDELKPGEKIIFSVSSGSGETVTMPKLLGMKEDVARKTLEKAKLKVGTITEEPSDIYPAGEVIWQQVEAGGQANTTEPINLKISSGPSQDFGTGIKSVAIDIDYDKANNAVFFLTVTVSDEDGTRNVISREQRLREDENEILSVGGRGSGTITVLFDNDVVMKKNVNFNTGVVE